MRDRGGASLGSALCCQIGYIADNLAQQVLYFSKRLFL